MSRPEFFSEECALPHFALHLQEDLTGGYVRSPTVLKIKHIFVKV